MNDMIKAIESGEEFEGYLWYSDKSIPRVIEGEFEGIELMDGENPFVIEGQLVNFHDRKSYSIKFVDGKYLLSSYELTQEESEGNSKEIWEYASNGMDGKTLRFIQRWAPVPDVLCEGMDVLRPAELVFIGFKH